MYAHPLSVVGAAIGIVAATVVAIGQAEALKRKPGAKWLSYALWVTGLIGLAFSVLGDTAAYNSDKLDEVRIFAFVSIASTLALVIAALHTKVYRLWAGAAVVAFFGCGGGLIAYVI